MSIDLTKAAAYSDKTPYELWQQQEDIPIHTGLSIDDLTTVKRRPVKTLEVRASGGTQIDYQNQDPEIHETFIKECAKRGVDVRLKF